MKKQDLLSKLVNETLSLAPEKEEQGFEKEAIFEGLYDENSKLYIFKFKCGDIEIPSNWWIFQRLEEEKEILIEKKQGREEEVFIGIISKALGSKREHKKIIIRKESSGRSTISIE